MASLIERLLEDHPETMAGLFFGLILGSVVVSWRLVRSVDRNGLAIMFVSAAAFFLLLGLRTDTESTGAEVVTKSFWVFFLAGAVAVCAMILPGISGSFILVIIGMYTEVLGAVNDRDLVLLIVFVLGCVTGLASFSTLLNWSLEHHHDRVLACMIGLMLGSLRVLWPWPEGVASTRLEAPHDPVFVPVLVGAIGLAVVLGIEFVGAAAERRRAFAD
jgi:putative membrane protein